jgi:hypothetical protein
VYGVPVFWLPFFWLRSAGRVGLLPPEVAYRGADGLFLGDGVHVPWKRDDETNGLDVRAGGYVEGGVDVDARMTTDKTTTRVRWDRFKGDDGAVVDAHGTRAIDEGASVAWDVDAIRGSRGVVATTDLDAASRAYDRASAEASWRVGNFVIASGVRGDAARGGDGVAIGAGGPFVRAHFGDAIFSSGAYDASIEAGALQGDSLPALSFARAEAGAHSSTQFGAALATFEVRAAGDAIAGGPESATNDGNGGVDGAALARAQLALPLGRAFATSDANDPLLHRIEPRLVVGALATHADDALDATIGRGLALSLVRGAAWFSGVELVNALGFWGRRDGAELLASAGAVGDTSSALFVARARASSAFAWFALSVDGALVSAASNGSLPSSSSNSRGEVAIARLRVGPQSGVHIASWIAARNAVDPVVARLLTDAPLSPSNGFLASTGTTYGASIAVPFGRRITLSGGGDGDANARELVAARTSLELHDPCGCFVVRASAAHRIGRDGVDAWITLDIGRK